MAQSADGREQVGLEGPDGDATQSIRTVYPSDAGTAKTVDTHADHAHRRHHAEQADIHAVTRNDAREDDVVRQPEHQVSDVVKSRGVLELLLEALASRVVHRRPRCLDVALHCDHEIVLQQDERGIAARSAQTVSTRRLPRSLHCTHQANIPIVTKITARYTRCTPGPWICRPASRSSRIDPPAALAFRRLLRRKHSLYQMNGTMTGEPKARGSSSSATERASLSRDHTTGTA